MSHVFRRSVVWFRWGKCPQVQPHRSIGRLSWSEMRPTHRYVSARFALRRQRPLTARQRAVLEFIAEFIAARGYPPTWREIADAMGIRGSTTPVQWHLQVLERKGYLSRDAETSRGIRVLKLPD